MAECAEQVSVSEARRQKRRQKILMGSEDRMKKIMGYNENDSTEDLSTTDRCTKGVNDSPAPSDSTNLAEDVHLADADGDDIDNDAGITFAANEHTDYSDQIQELDSSKLFDENIFLQSPKSAKLETKSNGFMKIRTLVVLFTGILVRISLEFSVGVEYVQCLFNPFIALEIALVGYQRAVGMDLGEHVKGGVWLSTLVLTGMKEDIIQIYKSVMGAFSAAAADFTLFFFGFIIVHLVL